MTSIKSCPSGYILRKGYTRKFSKNIKNQGFTVRRKGQLYTAKPTTNTVYVPPLCIKDRKINSTRIGKLRKGDLIKYGYQSRLSDRLRHKALEKAIDTYGPLITYRKLDAVVKLSVRTAPKAHQIFLKDREWIRANFELKKE